MRLSILIVSVGLTGCGGPFAAARREGTSLAYAGFVAQYPDHAKAPKAARRAEELDWASACAADDAGAYSMYVVTHPTGPNVAEARVRAEQKAWEKASAAGTSIALADYMASFPQGAHLGQAQAMVEDAFLAEARLDDSVDSWGRYLYRYPDGRYVEEARTRRDGLAWSLAVERNTKASYEHYLRDNPRGVHREEARAWLGALAVSSLQPVLLVGNSWRPERGRSYDVRRLQDQVQRGLYVDLKRDIPLQPLIVHTVPDLTVDPRDVQPVEVGTGLLVITVEEEVGRGFDPQGHATDLPTTVAVWVATTDEPLWDWSGKATTPEKIFGSTEESLYTEAVEAWGGLLRSALVPAEQLKSPEIP